VVQIATKRTSALGPIGWRLGETLQHEPFEIGGTSLPSRADGGSGWVWRWCAQTPASSVARAWNQEAGSNGTPRMRRITLKNTRRPPETVKVHRPKSARRLWKNARRSSFSVSPEPMAIGTGGCEVVVTSRLS
jgi:hypothetical protein